MTVAFRAREPVGGPTAITSPPAALALFTALTLTCLASCGMGLLVSACTDTLERAVYAYTGVALVQVAINGVLIKLDGVMHWVSVVVPTRLGVAAQLSYAGQPSPNLPGKTPNTGVTDPLWRSSVGVFWGNIVLLLGITIVTTLIAAWVLERKLCRPSKRRRGG